MEAEEPSRPWRGGARRLTLSEGQRFCVTGMSLADRDAARRQPLVSVWAEVGHEVREVGMLWSEDSELRITSVSPLELDDAEFVLRHDSAWSSVRLYGYYLDPPDPDGEGAATRRRFVVDIDAEELPDEEDEEEVMQEYEPLTEEDLAEELPDEEEEEEVMQEYEPLTEEDLAEELPDEEEEEEVMQEYEPLTEEDLAERYDSDNGEGEEEEDDDQPQPSKASDAEVAGESSKRRWNSIALVAAPAGIAVPGGEFLGPPRFAAVKNTAGFMQIAAAEAAAGSQEGREIVVLYRYTRFSRTWSGRRGVEACRRTKLHWLRFAVPPAGDMASSLAWAGSSLSPLIYPGLFRLELRDLWSSLTAVAATTTIPPHAARLQVVVDVGILRREDHTAERMEHMRGALEAITGEAWPEYYHVGMELQLPEPVRREDEDGKDGDHDARPAKRRRVAATEAEEECSLCLDPLESGLAAWPGCQHEFHGECVEKTLERSEACPLCRRKLSDTIASEAIQSW